MYDLKIGDTIECLDPDDMVDTMQALACEGIDTDFRYSMGGVKGLWLEVVGYFGSKNKSENEKHRR